MKQGAARTNFSAGHIQYLESSSSPTLALPSLCLWAYLQAHGTLLAFLWMARCPLTRSGPRICLLMDMVYKVRELVMHIARAVA